MLQLTTYLMRTQCTEVISAPVFSSVVRVIRLELEERFCVVLMR